MREESKNLIYFSSKTIVHVGRHTHVENAVNTLILTLILFLTPTVNVKLKLLILY